MTLLHRGGAHPSESPASRGAPPNLAGGSKLLGAEQDSGPLASADTAIFGDGKGELGAAQAVLCAHAPGACVALHVEHTSVRVALVHPSALQGSDASRQILGGEIVRLTAIRLTVAVNVLLAGDRAVVVVRLSLLTCDVLLQGESRGRCDGLLIPLDRRVQHVPQQDLGGIRLSAQLGGKGRHVHSLTLTGKLDKSQASLGYLQFSSGKSGTEGHGHCCWGNAVGSWCQGNWIT
mmetsp:Transcript_90288/g.206457  ORF Transcript_90288/g.206457 Transcript_90288/m.206457 type:complete len:234 (+) Transcript_90288:1059-1760(+)